MLLKCMQYIIFNTDFMYCNSITMLIIFKIFLKTSIHDSRLRYITFNSIQNVLTWKRGAFEN